MISYIHSIYKDGDYVFVLAMIEDMVTTYPKTMESPEEYGPALCEASFYLNEEKSIPDDENELLSYLSDLNLEWRVVDDY